MTVFNYAQFSFIVSHIPCFVSHFKMFSNLWNHWAWDFSDHFIFHYSAASDCIVFSPRLRNSKEFINISITLFFFFKFQFPIPSEVALLLELNRRTIRPRGAETQLEVRVHCCWGRSWSTRGNPNIKSSIGLWKKNSFCLLR